MYNTHGNHISNMTKECLCDKKNSGCNICNNIDDVMHFFIDCENISLY